MKAWLVNVAARLNALELKERLLLTVAAALVLGLLSLQLLFDPLTLKEQRLRAQIVNAEQQQADFDAIAAQILAAAKRDPNVRLREQLASLDTRIAKFEEDIRLQAGQLVAPEQVAPLLRNVLERIGQLEFVSLHGLGAEALLEPGENGEAAATNAYRHGFTIRFRGGYLDTIAYLRALEALPWRFFWDQVNLNVAEHPQAVVTVTVYTLSMDRSWIGV